MINLTSVQRYCQEYWKIENFQEAINDQTKTWHCHHRKEIELGVGWIELCNMGLYYDVHYSELIFLTSKEHNKLHKIGKVGPRKGHHHTEEAKQKMKGNQNGLKYHITEEELYKLYIEEDLSTIKIAKIYGCCPDCIRCKLKKFNISKSKS